MRIRRLLLLTTIAIVLGLGALLAIWGWIQWRYDRQVLTDVAAAPKRPVAIVFGAGIRADGGLSPMLQDRMDAAIALYKAGKVRKLLVSGDNRFANYNEPGRMYDYAVRRGVPPAMWRAITQVDAPMTPATARPRSSASRMRCLSPSAFICRGPSSPAAIWA